MFLSWSPSSPSFNQSILSTPCIKFWKGIEQLFIFSPLLVQFDWG